MVRTASRRGVLDNDGDLTFDIHGKTFRQLRETNTGDGWAQSPLEAHLGLGNARNVQTLRIKWPSGAVQEIRNMPVRKFRTISSSRRNSKSERHSPARL